MTHQSSDFCYIAAADKMSKGSLDYVMNAYKYQHSTPCAPSFNIVGGNQQATMVVGGNLIDLETRIQRGENGNLASCPSYNFQPLINGEVWNPAECDLYKPQQQPIDIRTTPLNSCTFSSNIALIAKPTTTPFRCAR